jgi:hypothetical protein
MNTSLPEFVWNGRDFSNCLVDFLVSIFLSVMAPTGHRPQTCGQGSSREAKATMNALDYYKNFMQVEDKATIPTMKVEVCLIIQDFPIPHKYYGKIVIQL